METNSTKATSADINTQKPNYSGGIHSVPFDSSFYNKRFLIFSIYCGDSINDVSRVFGTQEKNIVPMWSMSLSNVADKLSKDSSSENKDEISCGSKSSATLASEEKDISQTAHSSDQSFGYKRERAETMPSGLSVCNELSYPGSSVDANGSLEEHSLKVNVNPSAISGISSIATSRFRSGSLTLYDRNMYVSAFGPSIFSSHWTQYLNSQNILPPVLSLSSKDEEQAPIKTLDYLGLVDASVSLRLSESPVSCNSVSEEQNNKIYISGINSFKKDLNRIRSYSVSAKDEYEKSYNSSADMNKGDVDIKDMDYSDSFDMLYQNSSSLSLRPRARTTGVINFSLNYMDNKIISPQPYTAESHTSENSSLSNIALASQDSPNLDKLEYGDVMSQPTRSLWIINLPLTASNSSLTTLFSQFGVAESIWILADKKYGFVNYTRLESAIQAKASLDGKELFPGNDPIRVEYIKTQKNPMNMYLFNTFPFATKSTESKSNHPFLSESLTDFKDLKSAVLEIALNYSATQKEANKIWKNIQNAGKARNYASEIPPIPELSLNRQFYSTKLKEIRKKFETGGYTQKEIDEIAYDMIDEVSELSSDYIGNTIVQKLFEHCSEKMKEKLLKEIAPHLSGIGIHKNGTWAAQKIIDLAKTETQINDIIEHLSPYIPLLFLDQFGNYVVQCCLKFEAPMNNFIIEIMAERCWEISQGRFGARAMRACLESNHVTKEQQRYLAVVITLESHRLATNPNGIILLTWLLDSPAFPSKYRMLAMQFVHYIVYLCTHKLASSIILRIVSQKTDSDARKILLNALFFSYNGQILNEVLSEENYGVNTIFKIFTMAYLEDELRQKILIALKQAFLQLKVVPGQQYKSLMDEIGLNHSPLGLVSNMDFLKASHMKTDKSRDYSLPYIECKNNEVQEPVPLFSHPFPADYYKNLNAVNNNLYPLQCYPISQQKMGLQHYDVPFIQQQSEIPHHSFPYINSLFNQQYIPNGYPCSLPLYPFNVSPHRNQVI
ncbi:uncharacterized protein T551_02539 [Pneumocystis jirovecii RU7]|uniref:PUM-HD domain-containing protein n=1 Tax=Pneumocystis jirovecii (strain RU7) TaxID=1408657 RepID=A0A0W4ZJX7_PNEJ7|nr:uncharacterized protein T551_02539 [Pneumocystis jirovecii RU7]KTW28689.1 hypothetical protein T551_02539 [Pneumocystis jirovecii RU7]